MCYLYFWWHQVVGTMRTVEEFWQLHRLLSPPSFLSSGVDLALFRAGVVFSLVLYGHWTGFDSMVR